MQSEGQEKAHFEGLVNQYKDLSFHSMKCKKLEDFNKGNGINFGFSLTFIIYYEKFQA